MTLWKTTSSSTSSANEKSSAVKQELTQDNELAFSSVFLIFHIAMSHIASRHAPILRLHEVLLNIVLRLSCMGSCSQESDCFVIEPK